MNHLKEENDTLKANLKSIQGTLKGILIQEQLRKSTKNLIKSEINHIDKLLKK